MAWRSAGLLAGWLFGACCCALSNAAAAGEELEQARNRQDRAALERILAERTRMAERKPGDAAAQAAVAEAASYLTEVALELGDRDGARSVAETGIRAAERAVALAPKVAEYHRLLGALCGQTIPGNVLLAVRYGKCAAESIQRAIELDPQSWRAWLSRGVGHYYLPLAFGGGVEKAIEDFRKALQLNPRAADAWLWLGIALRKAQRNAEARQALLKSLELNPERVWARRQLEKTPGQ
ncbi:MAG: tetratricopeptide repeat protein [Bryobacteraceae bacterium]